MKILQKTFFSFAIVASLLLPQPAIAQTAAQNEQCNKLREQFQNAGGGEIIGALPEYCSVGSLYTKFLNLAMYVAGIVAVLSVIYGGYLYMTAGGNDVQRKKGRSVLTWAIVGLVVVIAAAVIINVVLRAVVENRFV